MLPKTLRYVTVLACGLLTLAGLSASAGDKKDDKAKPAPSGVWVLKGGELKIDFSDKDVMKVSPHGDNAVIVILCKYTVEKDGTVKAKITEVEGKDDAKEKAKKIVPIGLAFSFQWQVKGDTATLGELKGDNIDALKAHLEGKYESKK